MPPAAATDQLRKHYGNQVALDGLTLAFPEGRLTGFLGPNGAGKTTTFRVLLGLARPSFGDAELLGTDVRSDLRFALRRVGAVVEGPALYPTLSGRDNLSVARYTRGRPPEGAFSLSQVLDLVGLGARADDKVAKYSKGMKQRLALAMALMDRPRLLLLDEPLDGLDPAGQREVREFLRRLVDEAGTTVVISSHVLADVQALADHVVVIRAGRAVAAGSMDELVGGDFTRVLVLPEDLEVALAALGPGGLEASPLDASGELRVDTTDSRRVVETLARSGVYPIEVGVVRADLETVFLRLTGE